ncbi:copper homeostasis protein [Lactobacillus colini]|uniref:PF03932 family protein CutC n=1 Tax=Lactobacillus colini TaxID=1819254 RepID=A0ABS4MBS3_9LACO|nr:copper homeostasis protein CutC [Lactobacillus colini]MBP2057101.1 copper homeostasis protein [Lactobacillus colini]
MVLKEVCIGNYRDIQPAINAGADRIELNADLAVGGVTPSFGVIQESVKLCHQFNIPIVVMLRPRGGSFVYNEAEFTMMSTDLVNIATLNADGIAFGCLNKDGSINDIQMDTLLGMADQLGLKSVMHMAFDAIPTKLQAKSIDWLVDHGCSRILTHGGSLDKTIESNIDNLKNIISLAKDKIEILPGGGITYKNFQDIIDKIRVNQVHGTKIVKF